eukprot:m51a1_g10202 putative adenylate cyclase (504) ;mRNA; r:52811-54901
MHVARSESSLAVRDEARRCRWCPSSLRVRTLVPVAALALLGAGVICGSLSAVSLASSSRIEHELAVADAGLAARALLFDVDNVYAAMYSWTFWDELWQYLRDGDPWGPFYSTVCNGTWTLRFYRVSAIVFIKPDGELLNGHFYVWRNGTELQPVQESLWRQLSRALLARGRAEGLFYDPLTDTLNVVTSSVVRKTDYTGDFVGWIVVARDVMQDLPESATQTDLCFSLFLHREEMDTRLRGLYEPLLQSQEYINISETVTGPSFVGWLEADGPTTEEHVQTAPLNALVATPSTLLCSPMSNMSYASYLGVGGVVSDVDGKPVAFLYIRSARTVRHTLIDSMEKLALICSGALIAHWVAVCLLVESTVLRKLSLFCSQIVSIASSKDFNERIPTRGRSELSKVSCSVNELMETLLGQSRKTSLIMGNMFPGHVLQAFRAGLHSQADHFCSAAFLFADICSFTSWSAATDAKCVVDTLNVLYCQMDCLTTSVGATKVRTIGDAYF